MYFQKSNKNLEIIDFFLKNQMLKHIQGELLNSLSKYSNEVHISIFRDFRQKWSKLSTYFDTNGLPASDLDSCIAKISLK